MTSRTTRSHDKNANVVLDSSSPSTARPIVRLAFIGNSILYYHDCPTLITNMLRETLTMTRDDNHNDDLATIEPSSSISSAATVTTMSYLFSSLFPNNVLPEIESNDCLRGGASLTSLYHEGNGMASKFPSHRLGAPTIPSLLHEWLFRDCPLRTSDSRNVIIMNDLTMGPARTQSRHESIQALQTLYLPLFRTSHTVPLTVIVIQTAAYQVPGLRDTHDLGDFHQFSNQVLEGCQFYVQTLQQGLQSDSTQSTVSIRLAPVGEAFRYIYQYHREDLFDQLYSWDHYHFSPHGTWLEASVILYTLYIDWWWQQTPTKREDTMTPLELPEAPMRTATYDPDHTWTSCRYLQPPDQKPLPRPTLQEAQRLQEIAWIVCREYYQKQGFQNT